VLNDDKIIILIYICGFEKTMLGKTHTMQGVNGGSGDLQGVQPRALALLLKKCYGEEGDAILTSASSSDKASSSKSKSNKSSNTQPRIRRKLSIAILEIYMERVRDLLDEKHGTANEVKHEVCVKNEKKEYIHFMHLYL
jgi:hypothetical protein